MKKYNIAELNQLYTEADSCDQKMFSEYRSNLQLISGEHWTKKGSKFWQRVKDSNADERQKLRITKNHMGKISKKIKNAIITHAPSVKPFPKIEGDYSHLKGAQLHDSVWQDIKSKIKFKDQVGRWVSDFSDIGEVCVKGFFNPNKGKFLGYQAKMTVDPMTMQEAPETDPSTGEMVADNTKPIFTGQIEYERIFAFNLLRSPQAKSMDESPYFIVRKMVPIEELKQLVNNDEEKVQHIASSGEGTYKVFDSNDSGFSDTKGQDMLREFYFRPCAQYPKGYFYFATSKGVLHEGELPEGIWPFAWRSYDEVQTSPRGITWVRTARPYQYELNRSASQAATHSISIGDDKIIIASGSKVSKGMTEPGIRFLQVSGPPPTILPGRTGEQFIPHMNQIIDEMYNVVEVSENDEEKSNQLDPFAQVFASMRNKKKFIMHAEKFEGFLVDVCEVGLRLAKAYYDQNHFIVAAGKNELVNIEEFKKEDDLCYQIKIEPIGNDIDESMGKQITLNHLLQYVGKDLKPQDRGMIIRAMPFLDKETVGGDFTLEFDNVMSDILALDRGEYRPADRYDDHQYHIKKFRNRTKKSDFEFLDPQIKAMYQQRIAEHEEFDLLLAQEIQMAQAGFIPASGPEVMVQLYDRDPTNPGTTKRIKLPSDSIMWLVKKLESQGSYLQGIDGMPQGQIADMGQRLSQTQSPVLPGDPSLPQSQGPQGGLNGSTNGASKLRNSNPTSSGGDLSSITNGRPGGFNH
jgi:hypothetical protein